MLKFPIREMKKRKAREMGLIHIGGEVKPAMSLGSSLGRQSTHFPYSGKGSRINNQTQWSFLFHGAFLLLDH